ncbi:hypothetical protein [Microcoleus sp. AT3-D2]|uniref:hypothetical protein n=1 Tax=Microcoleus sp. AT3-D2 TaxID=2818612 RepID=UPI002FD2D887
MEKLPDLKQLSNEAKEALIVELWQEIQKLTAALVTTGEAKPNKVPTKTSKNSSTPPSKGFKANIKPSKIEGSKRQRSVGRAGGGRELHPHPDQTIIAQVKNCPQCGEKVTAAAQKLQSVYEKIELPSFARSSPESNVMVVSVPADRPSMLHQYHWEWNQVHRLAGRFKA